MKALVIIFAGCTLAGIGWWLAPPNTADQAYPTDRPDPPTINNDPVEVFQRAFWKRPSAEDRILHAERREWSDAHGINKWQWFIAVQPSPALLKHLREDNAFNLIASTTTEAIDQAPAWFLTAGQILRSPQGNLRLIFNDQAGTLHATDSGAGFKPGAPEPAKPLPVPAKAGRLPTTPPPNAQ